LRKLGFIVPETHQEWVREYKQLYGEGMPAFPVVYETFNFVAKKIGEAASDCLIKSVFETLNPTKAFIDILGEMVMIYPSVPINAFLENPSDEYFVWSLSDEETDFLINFALKPSLDHGWYYFHSALSKLDPDDSRYKKVYLMYLLAMRAKECRRNKKNDFSRFLFDSPKAVLFTKYSDKVHPFSNLEGSGDVEYGNFVILLEAIRQQLGQGMGLLCPFWDDSTRTCCSRRNKAFLEKVWKCTSPTSDCECWERLGCLKKKAVAAKTRISTEHCINCLTF
jgi:hypothetical protein